MIAFVEVKYDPLCRYLATCNEAIPLLVHTLMFYTFRGIAFGRISVCIYFAREVPGN